MYLWTLTEWRASCASISDEEDFTLLKSLADNLGQAAVSGNLSQSIGFNVSSMGLIPPPPSSSDERWKEVMRTLSKYPFFFQRVAIGSRFSAFLPQEATTEVTREEPTVSYVSSVYNLLLILEPIAGEFAGPLYQQPSLMAVDEQVGLFCKMIKWFNFWLPGVCYVFFLLIEVKWL